MKIYYQWVDWAYSHKVSLKYADKFWISDKNVIWLFSFKDVFEKIKDWNIWVLPIENSYAWSVHENFYHISSYSIKIISEFYQEIDHYLLWNTKNKKDIKKIYSHPQALMQCENYINKNLWDIKEYWDTAWAAKHIKEKWDKTFWAIASDLAGKIYWLNVLDKSIQDQNWNTTRFFVIVSDKLYKQKFEKNNYNIKKSYKISVLFKTKDIPAALYKCMWSFATRFINLTKIESLPSRWSRFEYMFWLDFEKNVEQKFVDEALEELKFFSKDLKILWDY